MAKLGRDGSGWRSARLPIILLLLYLAALAGLVAWLTLASSPKPVRIGGIEMRLGQPPAAPPAAEQAAAAKSAAMANSPPAAKTPTTSNGQTRPKAAAPKPAEKPMPEGPKAEAVTPHTAVPPAELSAPKPPAAAPPSVAAPAPAPSPAAPTPEPLPPAAPPSPPSTTAAAPPPVLRLPHVAAGPPLGSAPDPALLQQSPAGALPKVGIDGREAWKVYARPFDDKDKRPRIAIVIYGLGISPAATEAAIQGLPGAISLDFSPYAQDLRNWIAEARAAGHEVLLTAPMEPDDYPAIDPGPQALLTSLNQTQNAERLQWILGRATSYVGVMNAIGSRFTASRRQIAPVLRALKSRGLMFLDSHGGGVLGELANQIGVPFAASAFFLDEVAARPAIDQRLAELERLAHRAGRAIAMGFPYPVTLERVALWAQKVESRGFVLAPVSALATEPASP